MGTKIWDLVKPGYGVLLATFPGMAVPSMACPTCDCDPVSPHPESTANVAFYDCPQCGQEWSARFHGDRPFMVLTYSHEEGAPVDPLIVDRFRLTAH